MKITDMLCLLNRRVRAEGPYCCRWLSYEGSQASASSPTSAPSSSSLLVVWAFCKSLGPAKPITRAPIGAVIKIAKKATVSTSIPYFSSCSSWWLLAVSRAREPIAACRKENIAEMEQITFSTERGKKGTNHQSTFNINLTFLVHLTHLFLGST